jgi:hypothetical protein
MFEMFENLNLDNYTMYLIVGCVLVVGALVYFKFFRNTGDAQISCSVVDMQNSNVDVIDADESNEQATQLCDGDKCYISNSQNIDEQYEQ